jgi:hypothetical protein
MAEPLTSSDIIRLEKGFGPSSEDERRRRFDAGELPVSRSDFSKIAEGRGISSMASKSEKDAWVATEVMSGRRDPMELPKSYGGLGDRPEATTRRGFRMQQEWDKQREMMMEEQRIARELEQRNKQMESLDLDIRLKDRQLSVAREEDIFNKSQQERTLAEQEQAFRAINAVRGQPNAYEAASEVISGLPFAAASEPVQKALDALGQARNLEGAAKMAAEQEKKQKDFYSTYQSLLKSGVPEKDIPKYLDTTAPAGELRFDQKAVSVQLGTTEFKEKQASAEKREETPVQKIESELAKAQGEHNERLLSGEEQTADRAKIAGLREAYKQATGKDAPEILPRPTSGEQYSMLPAGTRYIGRDGKIKTKQ